MVAVDNAGNIDDLGEHVPGTGAGVFKHLLLLHTSS